MLKFLQLVGLIFLCCMPIARATDCALPRVLFLGDEVMQAYQPNLIELLKGRADCQFVMMPKSCNPNWGEFYADYIEDGDYDVIHFAYGRELTLHVDDEPVAAEDQLWGIYTTLIHELKKSGAFLVGCTTTPVRGQIPEYKESVDWAYLYKFKGQLGPAGIKVNDLGDYTKTRLDEMVQQDSNLPTGLGAQMMAEQVANAILEALNEGSDPNRPRILIVGDSIVGGYYSATRNLFAGEAVVYSGGTTYNDAQPDWKRIVDKYIEKGGDRGWDIIQFNWGLHAVKHVDENNKTVDAGNVDAHIQFPAESYLKELEAFVDELMRTNASLVFATTTPIPENTHGAIVHLDLSPYNEGAKRLMENRGIMVNDLYSFANSRLSDLQIPRNVHFTTYGSGQLAQQNYSVLKPLLEAKE